MKLRSIYIGIFFLGTIHGAAQQLDTLLKKAELLYIKTATHLVFPNTDTALHFPFNAKISQQDNVSLYQVQLKELEAKQYQKDWGLVFKARANYNFRNVIDDEFNAFNIGRVTAELEWNILKNGWLSNALRAKQKYNDAATITLQQQRAVKQIWRRQFRIDYTYVYNKEAMTHFTNFLAFENQFFDFLQHMYTQQLIKREKMLKVGQQILVLQQQIKVLQKENQLLKDSVSLSYIHLKKLPLYVINKEAITLANTSFDTSFEEQNIKLQHKSIHDIQLSLYVNHNYLHNLTNNIHYPAIGIRFSIPIRGNHKKEIIATKIKLLQATTSNRKNGQLNRVVTHMKSYNEKLKDLQHQFKSWTVLQERIRVLTILKNEFGNKETGLLILELVEEQFKVLENVLQLKRQLYTTIAHVFEFTPHSKLHNIIQKHEFNPVVKIPKVLLKESVNFSIKFQIDYLKAKGIKHVFLSQINNRIKQQLALQGISYSIIKNSDLPTVAAYIQQDIKMVKYEKI